MNDEKARARGDAEPPAPVAATSPATPAPIADADAPGLPPAAEAEPEPAPAFAGTIDYSTAAAIAGGYYSTPFDILGIHQVEVDGEPSLAARSFQPQALAVRVVRGGRSVPMDKVHPDGLFEAVFPGEKEFFSYRLSITMPETPPREYEIEDPYRYPPVLTDFDLHLFQEGNHFRLHEKLGAHPIRHHGTSGVSFAVWAPSAERVSVIGSFNQWDGRRHPMRPRGSSGIWEIFIPGLREGDLYKYEVKTRYHGYMAVKSDPYALCAEMRPNTASVVWDLSRYQWGDEDWMAGRRRRQALDAPIAIYEVHPGSWKRTADPIGLRWLSYLKPDRGILICGTGIGMSMVEDSLRSWISAMRTASNASTGGVATGATRETRSASPWLWAATLSGSLTPRRRYPARGTRSSG